MDAHATPLYLASKVIFKIILNYAFFPRKDFQIPSLNKILTYSLIFYFSFERYIRICYYCQLRETSVLSEDNVKFYKLFVVLFPILFYVPKCFEVRSHYVLKEVKMEIDCQKYLSLAGLLENPKLRNFIVQQFNEADLDKISFLAGACEKVKL